MIRLAYETDVAYWLRRRISLIWMSWHKWIYVAYHYIYSLLLIQLFPNDPWVMSLDSGCSSLCTMPLLVDSLLYMFNQKKDEVEISDIIKQRKMYRRFSSAIDILGCFWYSMNTEICFTLNFWKDISINQLHIMKAACSWFDVCNIYYIYLKVMLHNLN